MSFFKKSFLLLLLLCCTACSSVNKEKKQLTINLFSNPPSLDPRMATDSTSMNLITALFEGLYRINNDNCPSPALVHSMELSDDQCTYTFYLKKSYWNNGDLLTAQDFLITWQTILDPTFPAPFAYKFFDIKNAKAVKEGRLPKEALGIKALDDFTIQIELVHPLPYFLELLAFPSFYPTYRYATENWAANGSPSFVSNGPFCLMKWDQDHEISLRKNQSYWDKRHVFLNQLHFIMIEDAMTEYYMYEKNEIDLAGCPFSALPIELVPRLREENILHTAPSNAVYYYLLNTNVDYLRSKKIRQALAKAVNRQEIVEHILQGGQQIATSLVPHLPKRAALSCFKDHSIAEAKVLLKEGLADLGMEQLPSITLSYNRSDDHHKIALLIQQQLREALGIDIQLEQSDWQFYLDKVHSKNYTMARLGWSAEIADPIFFLNLFRYEDHANDTGWTDPSYQQLLERADYETNPTKRADLLEKAEELLMDEMPIIPLFFINSCYLQKERVKNVYRNRSGIIDFKSAVIRGQH